MNITFTVDSKRPDTTDCRNILQGYTQMACSTMEALGFSGKGSFCFYHPDEESEMNDIDYLAMRIDMKRTCKRLRSVACLSQIALALAAMSDGLNGLSWQCLIHEPKILHSQNVCD